jgi:hypothetical protein
VGACGAADELAKAEREGKRGGDGDQGMQRASQADQQQEDGTEGEGDADRAEVEAQKRGECQQVRAKPRVRRRMTASGLSEARPECAITGSAGRAAGD